MTNPEHLSELKRGLLERVLRGEAARATWQAAIQPRPPGTKVPLAPSRQQVWPTIDGRIEAQCDRTPQAAAIGCNGERITYRQLSDRATRLAHRLRQAGVRITDDPFGSSPGTAIIAV
jgi:non-ribosomal peptide synthetase component F